MRRCLVLVTALLALATAAVAHKGVENPAVLERMQLMTSIKDHTATLGEMLKGAAPFDADRAKAARAALARDAARIPALFEAPETDPKSEAVPAIWDEWDAFEEIAQEMEEAALALDLEDAGGLKQSFGAYAGTCRACHERFRID